MHILVVEDDHLLNNTLCYNLNAAGYKVDSALCKQEAGNYIEKQRYELIVLDVNLPDGNGFDFCKEVKERCPETAVIFLTVVDEEEKIVRAFDQGAADYVIKPFRVRELLARVKRTLSEREPETKASDLRIGGVRIDTRSGRVYASGEPVELTPLEYRLLLIFASNRGVLLSRSQILESIWDEGGSFVEDNTLTVYVKRLRDKLKDAVSIETVRGMGYRAGSE